MDPLDHCAASAFTLSQFFPPSVVRRMVPAQPTDQPWVASRKKMPSSAWVVPVFWVVQVLPPSVVAISAPVIPDAQPFSPTNVTSISFSLVPEGRGVQVWPPSSVPSTVPASPTAMPRLASRKLMARRGVLAADMVLGAHFKPPSAVTHRIPCSHKSLAMFGARDAASRSQQDPSPKGARIERRQRADA